MPDETEGIHPDVFNAAMANIFRDLEEIKETLKKQADQRVEQASKDATMRSELDALKEKFAVLTTLAVGLAVSVGGLAMWRLVDVIGRKP